MTETLPNTAVLGQEFSIKFPVLINVFVNITRLTFFVTHLPKF